MKKKLECCYDEEEQKFYPFIKIGIDEFMCLCCYKKIKGGLE